MRIGMLADMYKPHISGITNYISLNKRYLETAGHTVYVFTFGNETYTDDEPNVIRSAGLPWRDTGYFLSLGYSRFARQVLRTMDIAHIHHPFVSGSLALRYCRPRGIPLVFTNHTRYDLYAHHYLPALPEAVGLTALETFLPVFCRACDLTVSPSQGMQEVLRRLGVDSEIEVVPNGVELKPFSQPVAAIGREIFGFSQNNIVFIYTGRLGPEKNLPFLLRSFAGCVQAFDDVRLLVIGDGPERENLQDRVTHMGLQGKVHFTGLVPYADLPQYLAAGDAFVTASVTEVHPLSVIEAMASGLPVLGIRSPGVGDIVTDGVDGFLTPEEDLAAFTARLARLATRTVERQTLGRAARLAAQEYAIERTSSMMIERYDSVIQRAAERRQNLRDGPSLSLERRQK